MWGSHRSARLRSLPTAVSRCRADSAVSTIRTEEPSSLTISTQVRAESTRRTRRTANDDRQGPVVGLQGRVAGHDRDQADPALVVPVVGVVIHGVCAAAPRRAGVAGVSTGTGVDRHRISFLGRRRRR